MILIWGSRQYGKVDEVPGLFHVATRFGHLWYIPLLPMKSYAVFGEDGDSFRGLELPLSMKSVLVGWARAALIVGTIVLGIFALLAFGESALAGGLCLVGAAVAAGLTFASYRWTPICLASYERAMEIAERAGLEPRGMLALNMMYGRVSEAEADRLLAELEEQEASYEADGIGPDEIEEVDAGLGGSFGRRR